MASRTDGDIPDLIRFLRSNDRLAGPSEPAWGFWCDQTEGECVLVLAGAANCGGNLRSEPSSEGRAFANNEP
jgi:hypothetical protein